jgi:hypothetical protein
MRRLCVNLIVILGCVLISSSNAFAAWAESKNQGMVIRHPQGWQAQWDKNVVVVAHPKYPEALCFVSLHEAPGSNSQLITRDILKGTSQNRQGFKVLLEKRISSKPDIYGAKYTYISQQNTPLTVVALVASENGRDFCVREYMAPTKIFDDLKLTLIPILCSFCTQEGGSAQASGGWQYLESPHRIWRFTAPAGWKAMAGALDEEQSAQGLGPKEQLVGVEFWSGATDYVTLIRHNVIPNRLNSNIGFVPAAELLQRITLPALQITRNLRNLRVENIQPIDAQTARFALNFTAANDKTISLEGILRNTSLPNGQGGDFNLYTLYYMQAPRDVFPSVKAEAWQVAMSFEPSPQWGSFLMQQVARMRGENLQAATNRALQTMQSNKQIMAQHVGIAQQRPGQMAQQGQGWINAVTGQEVVKDPQSGQRWQVPVGGQYIYGRNTGEIIRADRPLQTHELPEGFRQFEGAENR